MRDAIQLTKISPIIGSKNSIEDCKIAIIKKQIVSFEETSELSSPDKFNLSKPTKITLSTGQEIVVKEGYHHLQQLFTNTLELTKFDNDKITLFKNHFVAFSATTPTKILLSIGKEIAVKEGWEYLEQRF